MVGPASGKACRGFIVCSCSLPLTSWQPELLNIQSSNAETLAVCVESVQIVTVIDLVHEARLDRRPLSPLFLHTVH